MIFPKEIINSTDIVFRYRNRIQSKVIYITLIVTTLIAFFTLPYVETDIYFSSRGVIRTLGEETFMVSPNSGYVIKSNIKYNSMVTIGDTLLVIDNSRVIEEIDKLKSKLKMAEENIDDLNYLLFAHVPHRKYLKLPLNQSALSKFLQQLGRIDNQLEALERIVKRKELLLQKKVIARAEYEKDRYEYGEVKEQKKLLIEDQKAQWQTQRKNEQTNLIDLRNRLRVLNRNKNEFVLIAQENGLLKKTKEMNPGTFVNSGEVLAEVSPNGQLVVEALIPPSKIGLLNQQNTVSYQVDAFNYRNWGLAKGQIIEIGKDIEIINNQPFFKVLSSINQTHLKLNNGVKGELKRGLTLSARFKITRRSLFDLLYDKIDDWLNPSQSIKIEDNIT